MLELSDLNVLAILVAWVFNIGLGAFWYSPAAFEKSWSKLSGVDMMKMPKDAANKAIMSVAVSSLVQVVTMAVFIKSLGATTLVQGLTVGLLVWVGFTAATTVGNNAYQRLSWKFWWLNASFFLVAMAFNSILFAVWK